MTSTTPVPLSESGLLAAHAPLRPDPAGPAEDGHAAYQAQLGGPVYVVDFGGPADGPVMVCVHGLGGSYHNWLRLAPLLTPTCRVLALDLAGHGRTPAQRPRPHVAGNQRLLDRFLTEVLAGPAVLVGNSMGGMISLRQSVLAPDTVAGLVLVNPALPLPRGAYPAPMTLALFAALFVPRLGTHTLARRRARTTPLALVEESLVRLCGDPSRIPARTLEVMERAQRERGLTAGADAAFVTAARSVVAGMVRRTPLTGYLRTAAAPTLLLHGTLDRLVPVAMAHAAARSRPDWRVEILAGLGHIPMLEDPDQTATIILDWLAHEGRPAAQAARRPGAGPAPGPLSQDIPTSANVAAGPAVDS
ncbi:alpha/beta hydrolase [Frankia sp. Ag45/Mut15]|uniref:Alpha/beta hydrolase n=1 Tax=Frankia umida TaxID=573489 RepID=A0ABT0K0V2_9ACTN|nr:alpha/beta hydrolase [Frankia umida]MCK9877426.1 alpha/beta hydrolase [Frankia umida]